jgi:ankyrin repeat protein
MAAEPDQINNRLLLLAARVGNLELMEELIKEGVDINYTNSEDENAFFHVMVSGFYDCAELLLNSGFDINRGDKEGDSPLFFEVRKNNFNGVKFLLEHNADIDVINKDGFTLLITAACYGYTSMMETLIECGANPDLVDKKGDDFMHYVRVRNVINDNFSYMKKFLKDQCCNIKPAKM